MTTVTADTLIGLLLLAVEIGFVFGWAVSEYRHAGKELRRVLEGVEADKIRYSR